MVWGLGIDLGTTFTAAAIARDGRAEIVSLGSQRATIPSVVLLREDGTFLTGEAAARRAVAEPTRVAREFKRRMGDTTPFLVAGSPVSPDALASKLLRSVVDEVVRLEGGSPDRIVITHPANWGKFKRDVLEEAVRLAAVDSARFISEPEAAAIHYAAQERIDVGTVIAVYDLGGGTFDAAVLRKTSDGFEVLGTPEGVERFGGIDFDAAVVAHVDAATGGAVSALDPNDASAVTAVARLRDDCILAKEALSSDFDTSIPVILPNLSTEVRLTRSEFESMIRPSLSDTIAALQRVIRSAGLQTEDVHRVLLVGGSTRIPLVSQSVFEALGRPTVVDTHPKHAVALGAARVGLADTARLRAEDPVRATAQGASVEGAPPAVTPSTSAVAPFQPAPRRNGRRRAGIGAGVVALVVAAVAAAAFAIGRSSSDGRTRVVPESSDGQAAGDINVRPVSATATSVRAADQATCGETVTFDPTNAIDDDPQTAWATAEPDGAGQRLTLTFDTAVHLKSIAMTPGYTRIGASPRQSCQLDYAFFENRVVTQVRYTFDDGKSLEQSLAADPRHQLIAVDTTTKTVVVEILRTTRPRPETNDVTLISDIEFQPA